MLDFINLYVGLLNAIKLNLETHPEQWVINGEPLHAIRFDTLVSGPFTLQFTWRRGWDSVLTIRLVASYEAEVNNEEIVAIYHPMTITIEEKDKHSSTLNVTKDGSHTIMQALETALSSEKSKAAQEQKKDVQMQTMSHLIEALNQHD